MRVSGPLSIIALSMFLVSFLFIGQDLLWICILTGWILVTISWIDIYDSNREFKEKEELIELGKCALAGIKAYRIMYEATLKPKRKKK